MDSVRGKLLVASPGLTDIFRRTVVLVLEHTEEGALGVILNRPSETEVDEAVPDLVGVTEPGAVVLGVSPDSPDRLRMFADKHGLPFTLLSDADHKVAEKYGVWVEKSMYGRTYMGVQRATFVIGPDRKVLRAFPKVSPKKHDELVLGALDELSAAA